MGNELSGDCRYECLMESNCVSVNVGPPDKNGLRVCQLSDSDHIQHPEDLTAQEGFLYWEIIVTMQIDEKRSMTK